MRLEGRVEVGRVVAGYRGDTGGSGGSWVRECLGQEGRLCGPPRGGPECDKWANVASVELGEHDISPVGSAQ